MRFVDVRNLLGKAFCDYLLTGEERFRELYLKADVPPEFKTYKGGRVNFYETFIGRYKPLIPAKGIEEVVKLGFELNRLGYYFEAHEVIEKYWLTYRGEYKRLLQALIQVAIANMHYEGGNLKGYNRMRELALENLKPYSGKPFGIDLERLRESIETASGIIEFPPLG